jgi:septal ring factor EnvC (AmiA/AmiB activator)
MINKYFMPNYLIRPLVILFVIFMASCNQEKIKQLETQLQETESELESTKNELEEAQTKISEIQSEVDNMESAVSQLRGEVDNFSYYNWRDVVPDVEDATSNIESKLSDLQSAAN